jgi:Protein of unknown function (DUF2857)
MRSRALCSAGRPLGARGLIMLRVKDPTLKRLLLEHMVEQLEAGGDDLDALLTAGVDPELLDLLRRRSARDFIAVAQMDLFVPSAFFDNDILKGCLQRIDSRRRDDELREYFVSHGAPMSMLNEVFKLSRDEARRLRTLLVPQGTHIGSPKMPAVQERQPIHEAWAQLERTQGSTSLRERVYELHQRFPDFSIAALWATVNEFAERPAKSGPKARSA